MSDIYLSKGVEEFSGGIVKDSTRQRNLTLLVFLSRIERAAGEIVTNKKAVQCS